MQLFVHENPEAVGSAVCRRVTETIAGTTGRMTLGLAGGSTPAYAYRLLRNEDGWGKVDAWLSDERWVPHDHDRSNGDQAASLLTDHVPARFIRPPWEDDLTAAESAELYQEALIEIFDGRRPDLILLGMGDDGHTASLFPGTEAVEERERLYVANHVPQEGEDRLTATYPLLWSAKTLIVMATGGAKAPALAGCLEGEHPGGTLGEGEATVEWHVDREAASLVS